MCENALRFIIAKIEELPIADKQEVLEFLKHDEGGIAFEIICDTLEKNSIKVHTDIYSLINDIGTKMDMPSALWEKLKF